MTYLLIIFLHGGALKTIIKVPDGLSCLARSSFEMRFDPRIDVVYCVPSSGVTA